jgi:hypothetical protein
MPIRQELLDELLQEYEKPEDLLISILTAFCYAYKIHKLE